MSFVTSDVTYMCHKVSMSFPQFLHSALLFPVGVLTSGKLAVCSPKTLHKG